MVKEEKEFKWVVNLLSQIDSKSSFKRSGATYFEIEFIANGSKGDKEFLKWFKSMNEDKVICFFEYRENSKGNPKKIYILDRKLLNKILDCNSIFKKLDTIFTIID